MIKSTPSYDCVALYNTENKRSVVIDYPMAHTPGYFSLRLDVVGSNPYIIANQNFFDNTAEAAWLLICEFLTSGDNVQFRVFCEDDGNYDIEEPNIFDTLAEAEASAKKHSKWYYRPLFGVDAGFNDEDGFVNMLTLSFFFSGMKLERVE